MERNHKINISTGPIPREYHFSGLREIEVMKANTKYITQLLMVKIWPQIIY